MVNVAATVSARDADRDVVVAEQRAVTGDGTECTVPGSWKVACTTHLLSGGGSGIVNGGDHGEFAYARVGPGLHLVVAEGR